MEPVKIALRGKYAVGEHAYALVDADDVHLVQGFAWKAKWNGGRNNIYALRSVRGPDGISRDVRMHRVILGLSVFDGMDVDHINHNSLDNRRANLRVVTRSENVKNRKWHTVAGACECCGDRYVRLVRVGVPVTKCGRCVSRKNAILGQSSAVYFPYCVTCGGRFTSNDVVNYFCSDACRNAHRSKGRKPSKVLPGRFMVRRETGRNRRLAL